MKNQEHWKDPHIYEQLQRRIQELEKRVLNLENIRDQLFKNVRQAIAKGRPELLLEASDKTMREEQRRLEVEDISEQAEQIEREQSGKK